MASDGSPPRSNPSLFNASLFSTPTTSTAGSNSDFSSLGGLGDNPFNSDSSFTLAPAAPVETLNITSSPPNSREGIVRPLDTSQVTELSTVPLDSPPASQVGSDHNFSNPTFQPSTVGAGWNDPPFLLAFSSQGSTEQPSQHTLQDTSSASEPSLPSTVDTYNVQPLLSRTEVPSASSISSPELPETNPYRLGGKRPAINTTPAYNVPPTAPQYASSTLQAPPTSSVTSYSTGAVPPIDKSVSPHGTGSSLSTPSVAPVQPHWFYRRADEQYWFPFSIIDSNKLEEGFIRSQADPSLQIIMQTDGGRYDVDMSQRTRSAVYWEEPSCPVRRCTWFFKGDSDRWYVPYIEDIANKLEEVFSSALAYGRWNCRVDLPDSEAVIFHSPTAIVHYPAQHFLPLNHEIDYHPKSVLRGFVERDKVDMGDTRSVDHLVFVVHGIGPFADIRLNTYKSLVDCVDDFREVSHLMLKTHKFGGRAVTEGRVEYLPVHWHAALHGDDTGVDEQVNSITLPSIAKLREFTNTTLIDVLFYTSPLYLQTILNQVTSEMNRMLDIFRQRNPSFSGDISVMGHSLGSCILFDLLYHQNSATNVDDALLRTSKFTEYNSRESSVLDDSQVQEAESTETTPTLDETLESLGLGSLIETFRKEQVDFDSLLMCSNDDLKELGVPMGPRKKLIGFISEWVKKKEEQDRKKAKLKEEKEANERQAQLMKEQSVQELKDGIEGIKYVRSNIGTGHPLVQYPKLNFEPTFLFALGSPIGLFLTVRGVESLGSDYHLPTCSGVFNIFHPFDPVAYRLEPLITSSPPVNPVLMPHHKGRKRFHLELYDNLERVGASVRHHIMEGMRNMWNQLNELARAHTSGGDKEEGESDMPDDVTSQASLDDASCDPVGMLNGGHRIDHVLQERPLEKLNQYLFALSSHLCYWRSEDTALFLLNQVYRDKS